jgi:hypothetical protein
MKSLIDRAKSAGSQENSAVLFSKPICDFTQHYTTMFPAPEPTESTMIAREGNPVPACIITH